ncbi:MAG: hypothetical protein EA387_15790, partial [Nitriliruptor sp.]
NLDATRPNPTDPDALASITVPVLLLQGDRTLPWFDRGNRHVVKHTPEAENRIIAGAGHGGPGLMPEAVADELARFLQRDSAAL